MFQSLSSFLVGNVIVVHHVVLCYKDRSKLLENNMYEQCKQNDTSNRRSYTLTIIIFVINIIFIYMCNVL